MKKKDDILLHSPPLLSPMSARRRSSLLSPLPSGPSPRRVRLLVESLEKRWKDAFGSLENVYVTKSELKTYVETVILNLMYRNQMPRNDEVEEVLLNTVLESMTLRKEREDASFSFDEFVEVFLKAIGIETKSMKWKEAKKKFDREMNDIAKELSFDGEDIPAMITSSCSDDESLEEKEESDSSLIVYDDKRTEEEEIEPPLTMRVIKSEKEIEIEEHRKDEKKNEIINKNFDESTISRRLRYYCCVLDLVCVFALIIFYIFIRRRVNDHREKLYELKREVENHYHFEDNGSSNYYYEAMLWQVNYMLDRGL